MQFWTLSRREIVILGSDPRMYVLRRSFSPAEKHEETWQEEESSESLQKTARHLDFKQLPAVFCSAHICLS
jgi:hypothetical protein